MKFKHLLLASLALFTAASCSDDSDGPSVPEYKQFDANLSIVANPTSDIILKSGDVSEEGTENEQFIQKLTAYVFYAADGKFAAMGSAEAQNGQSVFKIEDIIVKVEAVEAGDISPTALKVVLLANVELDKTPANITDITEKGFFKGVTNYSFSGVNANKQAEYLPMSSPVLDIPANKLAAGKEYDNWLEYSSSLGVQNTTANNNKLTPVNGTVAGTTPGESYSTPSAKENDLRIPLTRYVARVQLESLTSGFASYYPNAKFTLKKVHMANVSNASYFYPQSSSLQYVIENEAGGYDQIAAFFRGAFDFTRADYVLAKGSKSASLTKDYSKALIELSGSKVQNFKDLTTSNESTDPSMAQFYVFEFGSSEIGKDTDDQGAEVSKTVYTSLVLEGTWENAGVSETRYFRIPIKDGDTYGVKRNYIYKVVATLTGEGSDDPDKIMLNTFVSFSIKVENWKVVTQLADDVN